MKKTLQILFFSALSVAATAQTKSNRANQEVPLAPKKQVTAERTGIAPVARPTTNSNTSSNRVVVFHETFENGFAGSTPLGAWTHAFALSGDWTTTPAGEMWSIGEPGYTSPYTFPTDDALASASPAHYVLWDGVAYSEEFPATTTAQGAFYEAHLYAPDMDFSGMNSVLVDFQQYFMYCCFPLNPMSLDVSVDGGQTWTSFSTLGSATEAANVNSPNPVNTTIDISCVAANQSSVKLRFAYNSAQDDGYFYYFWQIDEVVIYDNEVENDLAISQLANGDIVSDFEYRVTPLEQIRNEAAGGVIVGAEFSNLGTLDQDNVTIKFDFINSLGEVAHTYTTEPFHLYSAPNDTVCPHTEKLWDFWATGIVITELGDYTLSAVIQGNQTPSANDSISKQISFSSIAEYGHDGTLNDLVWTVWSAQPTAGGPFDPIGFGSHYTMVNPGSKAHGITVRFGNSASAQAKTDPDADFKAVLIAVPSAAGTVNNGTTVATGSYVTRESWLTNYASEPLFFAYNSLFSGPGGVFPAEPHNLALADSLSYVAAIWREAGGFGRISVRAEEVNDIDLSSVSWERGGDQNFHWFYFQQFNYAVRLILSAPYVNHIPISTDDIETAKTEFTVFPNPAVNEARVSFNLTESRFIAYEVRDLNGKLMDTDNVGRFAVGENSFSLNVSDYPAGNYIVGLVIDGEQMLTKQISVVR